MKGKNLFYQLNLNLDRSEFGFASSFKIHCNRQSLRELAKTLVIYYNAKILCISFHFILFLRVIYRDSMANFD